MKGIVIAGTNSGCGKTTVTLGLLAALKKKLGHVAAFKVGPDFIDPGHHARITGKPGRNLDGWMLDRAYNMSCFQKHSQRTSFTVIEGVMGLFDGYDGKTDAGSTAQMAKWLSLPVVLVVNAKSMARSAAALVKGFESFDPDVKFAGVIFNQVGSDRHLACLKEAMEDTTAIPVMGGIPRNAGIAMPERHLGLVTSDDFIMSDDWIDKLAVMMNTHIDLDRLIHGAGQIAMSSQTEEKAVTPLVKIGVARDRAFCFYYQDNLDLLQEKGAELITFSPMTDAKIPDNLDGLYLGGGYPEIYAKALSENITMKNSVQTASDNGMPIYGECGGFMYLAESLMDKDGQLWPMTGALHVRTRMFDRLKSLGYREVTFKEDVILGQKNQTLRGHEFHYSEMMPPRKSIESVFYVAARDGQEKSLTGIQKKRTLGSYFHAHFGSCPESVDIFIRTAKGYQKERQQT